MVLVVFDGIDFCGKSTVAALVRDELFYHFREVHLVHFPSYDKPIGSVIKSYLRPEAPVVNQFFFSLLFELNRFEEIEILSRSVHEDVLVICDRYVPSGWCYALARGMGSRQLSVLQSIDEELPKADLTFILNVPPQVATKRMSQRNPDFMENNAFFQSIVSEQFKRLSVRYGWTIVDANRPTAEIVKDVVKVISEYIGLKIT